MISGTSHALRHLASTSAGLYRGGAGGAVDLEELRRIARFDRDSVACGENKSGSKGLQDREAANDAMVWQLLGTIQSPTDASGSELCRWCEKEVAT